MKASLDLVVYPYVNSQQRYGNLRAEVLSASRDVAALRVRGANSWPTVAVAPSMAGASALAVLGFTGVPSAKNPLLEINQHLAKPSGAVLKTADLTADDVKAAARLKAALGKGLAGGPVVAERGQVVGLLPGLPGAGKPAPDLIGVAAILPVLKSAGISAHGGPVDTSYEAAMHLFKNGAYAAAIPSFTKALELFPGHYRARANLAMAQERVKNGGGGNAAQVPGAPSGTETTSSSSGFPWLLAAGIGLGALLLAAVVVALVRRSRSGSDDHDTQPPAPPRAPVAVGAMGAAAGRASATGSPSRASTGPVGPARAAGPGSPGPAAGTGGGAGAGTGAPASGGARPGTPGAAGRPGSPPGPGTGRQPAPPAGGRPGAPAQPSRPVARAQASSVQQASAAQVSTAGFRFCTSCGGRLAAQHQFCGWCGEPVS